MPVKNLASSYCLKYMIHQHNFEKKNVASTEQLKQYITMAKCADSIKGAMQRTKGTWTEQSTRWHENWGIIGSPVGSLLGSFLVFHPSTRSSAPLSNPMCSSKAAIWNRSNNSIVAKSYRKRQQMLTCRKRSNNLRETEKTTNRIPTWDEASRTI